MWASLGLIATEGLVALLIGPQPFLAASLLIVAPGLALVAFLPTDLRTPVVRFAVVPVVGVDDGDGKTDLYLDDVSLTGSVRFTYR